MNNLISLIQRAPKEVDVIHLLQQYNCFDFVRNELLDEHDIDYTDDQFIDEQNILSLSDIKYYVIEAIRLSLK